MKTSRDDLLLIAFRLFLQQGYEQTSMRDLVTASGLSKGAFHHYFPRKGDLLNACIEHFFDRFLPHVDSQQHSHFADLMHDSANSYLRLFQELQRLAIPLPSYQRFVWSLLPDYAAKFAQHQSQIAAKLEQLAEYDIAQGHLKTGIDAESLALQAMALIEGLGVLSAANPIQNQDLIAAQFSKAVSDFLANLS